MLPKIETMVFTYQIFSLDCSPVEFGANLLVILVKVNVSQKLLDDVMENDEGLGTLEKELALLSSAVPKP